MSVGADAKALDVHGQHVGIFYDIIFLAGGNVDALEDAEGRGNLQAGEALRWRLVGEVKGDGRGFILGLAGGMEMRRKNQVRALGDAISEPVRQRARLS